MTLRGQPSSNAETSSVLGFDPPDQLKFLALYAALNDAQTRPGRSRPGRV